MKCDDLIHVVVEDTSITNVKKLVEDFKNTIAMKALARDPIKASDFDLLCDAITRLADYVSYLEMKGLKG